MPKRPCIECGALSDKTRCPTHTSSRERDRDQRRGSSTSRGYDRAHKQLRESWRPEVEAGLVDCWRCGKHIEPTSAWHLGHDDNDRTIYRGPEHVDCNCATSGRGGGHPQHVETADT